MLGDAVVGLLYVLGKSFLNKPSGGYFLSAGEWARPLPSKTFLEKPENKCLLILWLRELLVLS